MSEIELQKEAERKEYLKKFPPTLQALQGFRKLNIADEIKKQAEHFYLVLALGMLSIITIFGHKQHSKVFAIFETILFQISSIMNKMKIMAKKSY